MLVSCVSIMGMALPRLSPGSNLRLYLPKGTPASFDPRPDVPTVIVGRLPMVYLRSLTTFGNPPRLHSFLAPTHLVNHLVAVLEGFAAFCIRSSHKYLRTSVVRYDEAVAQNGAVPIDSSSRYLSKSSFLPKGTGPLLPLIQSRLAGRAV
jgi:hypothetical protein